MKTEALFAIIALAASLPLLLDLSAEIGVGCYSDEEFPSHIANSTDLSAVFAELMTNNYLAAGDRVLFVGPEMVGFSSAAVRSSANACCFLPFDENSFDLAFVAAMDRVRVPARMVLEMERVIRPGRFGVVFISGSGFVSPDILMKVTAPVSTLLRFSDVVVARPVNGSVMVLMKKRGRSSHQGVNIGEEVTGMPLLVDSIIGFLKSGVFMEEWQLW